MAKLTLISPRDHPLQPLVEAALANELRSLEAGIQRTEQRLRELEHQHQMTTTEFVARYESDELPETLEFAEWIGEYRLLMRLRDKAETVREIQFAD
jgi:phage shock protein A